MSKQSKHPDIGRICLYTTGTGAKSLYIIADYRESDGNYEVSKYHGRESRTMKSLTKFWAAPAKIEVLWFQEDDKFIIESKEIGKVVQGRIDSLYGQKAVKGRRKTPQGIEIDDLDWANFVRFITTNNEMLEIPFDEFLETAQPLEV
jgi:hypothetical protein